MYMHVFDIQSKTSPTEHGDKKFKLWVQASLYVMCTLDIVNFY